MSLFGNPAGGSSLFGNTGSQATGGLFGNKTLNQG